jgi:aldose 1-epimerase
MARPLDAVAASGFSSVEARETIMRRQKWRAVWVGGVLCAVAMATLIEPTPWQASSAEASQRIRPLQRRRSLAIRSANPVSVTKTSFGTTPDGQQTQLFTLVNAKGLTARLTDYGARLVALEAPDRQGKRANVTLGFDSLDGYAKHGAFFGCTTGRYANRIAKGKFTLDGKTYSLATNNGENHLHGGNKGFDRAVWKAEQLQSGNDVGVRFTHRSPDGDEGYPGNLDMTVVYTLTDQNELKIDYTAATDKPTVLNLTNHAYWNLAGAGSGKILDHRLTLAADKFLPTDKGSIPTGELAPVAGTVMDFREPHSIGERIAELKKDPEGTRGYDHCYVLNSQDGSLKLAAKVVEPKSGRVMEIFTTEPGVQLYTGNFLDGSAKSGGYTQHDALCLETQHFPDSPNQPKFPTTVLKPGQKFHSVTVHKFSVE